LGGKKYKAAKRGSKGKNSCHRTRTLDWIIEEEDHKWTLSERENRQIRSVTGRNPGIRQEVFVYHSLKLCFHDLILAP
jgi:hypothetical protein